MTEVYLHAQFEYYGYIKSVRMLNAITSTHDGVVKLASTSYSELRHATKAFTECDPAFRQKYSGYCRTSCNLEEETTKEEQGEGMSWLHKTETER